MSCTTFNQQPVRLAVSMGALPEGFCPASMQELAQAIADRLIVTPNQQFSTFVTGSTAPPSNQGPWFKDCEEWFVFDDATGTYVPMTFSSVSSVVCGTIVAWAGTIANIPAGYLHADGRELDRSEYPCLFAAIGTCYGSADPCECKFNIPDLRNKFIVGAGIDDAGCAKTNVSDGATLTKCRDYTAHTHNVTLPGNQAPPSMTQAGINIVQEGTYTTSNESPRAIPPYCAMVWMIKT